MELEATDSEKKQLSYATQFFGFTPDAFVDSIHVPSIEIVNEHLEVSVEQFLKSIFKSFLKICLYNHENIIFLGCQRKNCLRI